ncbi:MAG: hypothetical protein WDN28_10095 [Chthoniobacter sp.]
MTDTEPFAGRIEDLGQQYRGYASTMGGGGRDAYRQWIETTASANADTLAEFKKYLEKAQADGRNALSYLSKTGGDSYFSGYDKMPRELRDIVKSRNKPH